MGVGQRAGGPVRAGGQGYQVTLQRGIPQAADGLAAQTGAGLHEEGRGQQGLVGAAGLVLVQGRGPAQGLQLVQKVLQTAHAAGAFLVFVVFAVHLAALGAQFVEHVGRREQPGAQVAFLTLQRIGQFAFQARHVLQRAPLHTHLPDGLAQDVAPGGHDVAAQFHGLHGIVHGQHLDGQGAPFGTGQPQGQRHAQGAGTAVQQQGRLALLQPEAGIGQGQGTEQARQTQHVPGQEIIQIGAGAGRGTPVGPVEAGAFAGQQTGKGLDVRRQVAVMGAAQRAHRTQGLAQGIQFPPDHVRQGGQELGLHLPRGRTGVTGRAGLPLAGAAPAGELFLTP